MNLNTGLDPDDSFSSVPYIKGQVFIRYLEKLVGGPTAFEPYLKAHVAKWQRKTVTTGEFKTFFLEFFASEPAVKTIHWEKWLYSTGMPSDADIDIASPLSDAVQNLAKRWTSAASSCAFDWASSTDTDKWFMQQQELFLDALRSHFEQEAQSNEPERIARLRQMLTRNIVDCFNNILFWFSKVNRLRFLIFTLNLTLLLGFHFFEFQLISWI